MTTFTKEQKAELQALVVAAMEGVLQGRQDPVAGGDVGGRGARGGGVGDAVEGVGDGIGGGVDEEVQGGAAGKLKVVKEGEYDVVMREGPGTGSIEGIEGVVPKGVKIGSDSGESTTSGSGGSVEMPGGARGSRTDLLFTCEDEVAKPSFLREYVKNARTSAYAGELKHRYGVKIPKAHWINLALVSYTTATVPMDFVNGRVRIKGFENLGDAAMALVLVEHQLGLGKPVSSVQELRSKMLSNVNFGRAFLQSGTHLNVSFPSGVDLAISKVTADAFEALAGVIYGSCGLGVLKHFMMRMGLLDVK